MRKYPTISASPRLALRRLMNAAGWSDWSEALELGRQAQPEVPPAILRPMTLGEVPHARTARYSRVDPREYGLSESLNAINASGWRNDFTTK